MKFSELSPKNVSYISECVTTLLKRMCINADITMKAKTTRFGDEVLDVHSSEIKVIPAMFNNVHIEGTGYLTKDDNVENCFDFKIFLNYRYESFSGGSNGTEIGVIKFRIINDGFVDIRLTGMTLTASVYNKF